VPALPPAHLHQLPAKREVSLVLVFHGLLDAPWDEEHPLFARRGSSGRICWSDQRTYCPTISCKRLGLQIRNVHGIAEVAGLDGDEVASRSAISRKSRAPGETAEPRRPQPLATGADFGKVD
jgi:hypothetical protein